MPLSVPVFNVLLHQPTDDDPDGTAEHEARILHGDQLRAELEGPKHGLSDMSAAPMHFTTLWIWASLVRTKVVTEGFKEFKSRVLAIEAADDDSEVLGLDEAGPTQMGAAID